MSVVWLKALRSAEDRRARAAKVAQERALASALPRLAKRVSAAFVALEKSAVHGPEFKAAADKVYPLTYSEPSWSAFENRLTQILQQEYVNVGGLALGNVERQLGITLAFDLNERIIPKGVIARKVTGVTDMTKIAINKTIRRGIDDGVHPSVIAKRMRDQLRGYAGLEDLSKSRAYTIARTETANAYNMGAIAGYRDSGIVRQVRIVDSPTCGWTSHNDPDTANGKIVTLDQASQYPISHPNCVRALAPVAAGLEEKLPEPPADLYANPKDFTGTPAPNSIPYGLGTGPLEAWAHGIFESLVGKPTQEMFEALRLYQGSGYRWMNSHLRGIDETTEIFGLNKIDRLKQYVGMGQTPEAVVVWRGAGAGSAFGFSPGMGALDRHDAMRKLVGTAHSEAGFMSTALDKNAAFGGVKLELTVPKGYHAIPVSAEAIGQATDLGKMMSEAELLLRPGTRYVIESVVETPSIFAGGVNLILKGRVLP